MKKRKNSLRITVWLAILGLIIYFFIQLYLNHLLVPANPTDTKRQSFVVSNGESIPEISKRLKAQGLIRSDFAFTNMARGSEYADKIQTGDFFLSPSMSSEEILKELALGRVDKWVTLIEGWRDEEVAEKLNKELGIKREDFLEAAAGKQGRLFPDTYLFNPDVKSSDVVFVLNTTFDKKYTAELQDKIRLKGLTADQGVILASIVEREGRSDQVRKNVAGILLKRLKIGMALNADATIQYALGYQPKEKSWWKRNLTLDDLKVNSPFNTYIHAGLPPNPICNPSLSSLQAVAEADPSTSNLYYYHDSKGVSHYARTLDEHNQNVANYP